MNSEEKFRIDFQNHADLTTYAKEFSEGDILVEKVLMNLWNHNIKTVSCCIGHDFPEYYYVPYISFSIEKCNVDYINCIMNSGILSKKGVSYEIRFKSGYNDDDAVFSIYMRDNTRDKVLNAINDMVSKPLEKIEKNKVLELCISIIEYAKNNNYDFNLGEANIGMEMEIYKAGERPEVIGNPEPLANAINMNNKMPIGYFTLELESLEKLVSNLK